ncbi:MAG: hypothetical protein OJF50_003528 [Nitrospira sp.]|jgi:hypothetical protein|nr:hypothetical protein [Nitrospira sp.]
MSEKEAIVEKLKSIAGDLNASSVPRHEFLRRTGLSERKVQRLFGSYNNLVVGAGLQPRAFPTADAPSYSNDELLAEVVRVIRLPDAKLTRVFFEQNAKFSSSVCERRFGGWVNTVKTAAELLDPHKEEELLRLVREYTVPPHPSRVQDSPSHNSQPHEIQEQQEHPGHEFIQTSSANVYGEFINFRGLQYAPVNEQGVVFLFGMLCKELGYIVEIVKPGFPDCEAKRRIRG